MFDVVSQPTFIRDVKVEEPSGEGFVEKTLRTEFRVVADQEVEDTNVFTVDGMREYLSRVIVRFYDLCDVDGNEVDYSEALRDELLSRSYLRIALFRAYGQGQIKAKEGN